MRRPRLNRISEPISAHTPLFAIHGPQSSEAPVKGFSLGRSRAESGAEPRRGAQSAWLHPAAPLPRCSFSPLDLARTKATSTFSRAISRRLCGCTTRCVPRPVCRHRITPAFSPQALEIAPENHKIWSNRCAANVGLATPEVGAAAGSVARVTGAHCIATAARAPVAPRRGQRRRTLRIHCTGVGEGLLPQGSGPACSGSGQRRASGLPPGSLHAPPPGPGPPRLTPGRAERSAGPGERRGAAGTGGKSADTRSTPPHLPRPSRQDLGRLDLTQTDDSTSQDLEKVRSYAVHVASPPNTHTVPQPKFDSLTRWLAEGGAKFPNLYLRRYTEGHRGVHTRANVKVRAHQNLLR